MGNPKHGDGGLRHVRPEQYRTDLGTSNLGQKARILGERYPLGISRSRCNWPQDAEVRITLDSSAQKARQLS